MRIKFVNKSPKDICKFLEDLLDNYDLELHIANLYLIFQDEETYYDLYQEEYNGDIKSAEIVVNRRSLDLDYYEALDLKALSQNSHKKAVIENEDSPKDDYRVYYGVGNEGQRIEISREEYERQQATFKPIVVDIDDD